MILTLLRRLSEPECNTQVETHKSWVNLQTFCFVVKGWKFSWLLFFFSPFLFLISKQKWVNLRTAEWTKSETFLFARNFCLIQAIADVWSARLNIVSVKVQISLNTRIKGHDLVSYSFHFPILISYLTALRYIMTIITQMSGDIIQKPKKKKIQRLRTGK